MSSYRETIESLFNRYPMFQNIGAGAYKPGVERMRAMLGSMGIGAGFRCIHIAGTNGKGSVAHTIAAVLQSAGYHTGLYTSPHLVDFRERIRIDGKMISETEVVDFMTRYDGFMPDDGCAPSFFELTTAMAFDHFNRNKVDVAVVETGLGGRLDSTNVVSPCLSIITNISLDHVALLGDTVEKIAAEKAGIIKPGVPVVIGESAEQPGVRAVFMESAARAGSPIIFADEVRPYASAHCLPQKIEYESTPFGDIAGSLTGACQTRNSATILCALSELRRQGFTFSDADVARGFAYVCSLTGLAGRWMRSSRDGVEIICDTGHNTGGWQYLSESLARIPDLSMVIGFVNDKDVRGIIDKMPRHARYYFTQASVARALPAAEVARIAAQAGLSGTVCEDVGSAVRQAVATSAPCGTVFVGGSTFIVADYLASSD